MKTQIRKALHQDAANIVAAHRRSIKELCSKDYNSEQIAAWSGRNFQEERWHQTMDKDHVWVISDEQNNVYGFGHLKFTDDSQAEISGLYFVPEVTGQGLGKNLVKIMLEECRHKAVTAISLSATKTAKEFYKSVGFNLVGAPSTVEIGGMTIECFNMIMKL